MAFKIRLATKQRRKNYHAYLQRMQEAIHRGGVMLQDSDKKPKIDEAAPSSKTVQVGFVCPEAFEPAAFFVVAIDREGREFINTTPQPAVALHLATLGLQFASKQAINHIQREMAEKSRIIVAPAGSVPTFTGPAGRG